MDVKLSKVICVSLLLLHLGLEVSAQSPSLDLDFRQLSLEKGLSQSNVTSIIQDQKGFMWAGTQDGLNRFDAYSFRSFGTESGLSEGHVSTLFESNDGKIWIGNSAGKINVLEPERFEINQIEIPVIHNGAKGILRFFEDVDSRIWIATRNGIHVYDPESSRFYHFSDKGGVYDNVSRMAVYGIAEDKAGRIWAVGQKGLISIDHIQFGETSELVADIKVSPSRFPHLSSSLIFRIAKSRKGGFWLNVWQKGLVYYEPDTETYEFYPSISTEEVDKKVELYEILEDVSGTVWATSKNHGLLRLNPLEKEVQLIQYEAHAEKSLGSNTLSGLAEDRDGGIWVGTFGAGVNYVDPQASSFLHIKMDEEPLGLSYPLVYEIYASRFDESVWIGTHGGGLNRMKRKTPEKEARFKHFLPKSGNSGSLKDGVVISLEEDAEENLWVGTYHGLSLLPKNKKTQKLETAVFEDELGESPEWDLLETSAIWSMLYDKQGRMWVGTDKGLFRKNAGSEEWRHYVKEFGNPNSLRDYFIRELYQDYTGNIWFSTANGLHRYREKSDDFYIYTTDESKGKGLSTASIYCMLADKKGRIWVGTQGGGLNVIIPDPDFEQVQIRHFFETDGLPSNLIMGLLEDDSGQIWGSTSRGLFRFHPDSLLNSLGDVSKQLRIYDEYDGLQSNEFLEGAFAKTKEGYLFFGGVNGFNEFDPKEIKDAKKEVPVYFTQLKVLNKPVGIGDELRPGEIPLDRELSNLEQLNLSWKDYFFSIEFAALGYSFPEKTQYAYRLDGLNEDWYYIGNDRTVTFTNLNPGDYVLRVKAQNRDGVWNETERRLPIHISTPPWKSWWAYTFYVLGILALIAGYIRYKIQEREKELETRMRIKEAKAEERELVRKNTAADFHDELGNKMTKISLFIELAKRAETANQTLQVYLNQVEENTQILSQGIRDFIWVLDPEKDSVYDMLIRIKDFGDELFDHTEMDFMCEGIHPKQADYKLPLSSRRNLMLMAKETMNNSLKYSEAKTINLKAEIDQKTLRLEISDDGKGFELRVNNKGYGLKNIQTRSEKIGAKTEVISEPGKGTRILIDLNL